MGPLGIPEFLVGLVLLGEAVQFYSVVGRDVAEFGFLGFESVLLGGSKGEVVDGYVSSVSDVLQDGEVLAIDNLLRVASVMVGV